MSDISTDRVAGVGPPARIGTRRGLALALLSSVFAVQFLDRQIFAILIPPIKAEMHLSDTALGLISGFALTILFSTVGLVVGRIADRADRARIITWSLALFSVMTAACALATGFWQLFFARLGVGVGEGGTNPASQSMIADLFPMRTRSTAMAIYSIGAHVGLVLAFALGGWIGQKFGWRTAFVAAGALGMVLTVVTRFALRDQRATGRRAGGRGDISVRAAVGFVLRSATMRNLFAAAALASAAGTGLLTWLPALLTRSHGLTLAQAGIFLASAVGIAGAAGTLICGRLVDVTPEAGRKMLFVALVQAFLAVLWGVAMLVTDRVPALVAMIGPCALLGAYIGPTFALAQEMVDARIRTFAAAILLLVVNLLGAGVGPLVVGVLSDSLIAQAGPQSLRYALLAMPVLLLGSAVFYWRAAHSVRTELVT